MSRINRYEMEFGAPPVTYPDLVAIADRILEVCGEDVVLLSEKLDLLPAYIRHDLLVSDLLNAYQVFYYFFKESPGDLPMERLVLSPASSLPQGLIFDEIDLLELIFAMIDRQPVIVVSDGEHALATFLGTDAYRDGLTYIAAIL
jgi:hypothetical protein